MQLYYHKTSGGAEYLFDTYHTAPSGHKEGAITDETKFVVRIDGDITKDAELTVRDDARENEIVEIKSKAFNAGRQSVIDVLKEEQDENVWCN